MGSWAECDGLGVMIWIRLKWWDGFMQLSYLCGVRSSAGRGPLAGRL